MRGAHEKVHQTMEDLFGIPYIKISCDFPSHLNNFVTRFNLRWDINVGDILERHTLYPFFRPFLYEEQIETLAKMIDGTLKYRPHFILGIKYKDAGRASISFVNGVRSQPKKLRIMDASPLSAQALAPRLGSQSFSGFASSGRRLSIPV